MILGPSERTNNYFSIWIKVFIISPEENQIIDTTKS